MKIKGQMYRRFMFCKRMLITLVLLISVQLMAQNKNYKATFEAKDTIRGFVVDVVTGKPLVGANVKSVDGDYSAVTDEQGKFKLALPKYKRTLEISALGYDNKEVFIYNATESKVFRVSPIEITTASDKKMTSFGSKRKSTVSNSISSKEVSIDAQYSVDNLLINNFSGDINLTTHSGSPASGLSMFIRGINSIYANTMPLIVVDGVITEIRKDEVSIHSGNFINPLATIDVSDVQDISVLKDGTSIYGSKGSNGVILINTKRGKNQVTQIKVSTVFGYNSKPQSIPMMNTNQCRIYLSDLLKNTSAKTVINDEFFLNNNTNFIYYNKYHNNTDWSDGIYTNSSTQSYNVSVNGGDEIALYNMSVGYTNALSTLKVNDFTRINTRFNSDINFTTNLKTSFDISYTQSDRNMRNDGIDENYTTQLNSPGFLSIIKSPFLSQYQYSNARELTTRLEDHDFLGIANPYAILEYGTGKSQQKNFNLAITPVYKFNHNIKLSSNFSYNIRNLAENMFSPMYGVAPFIDFVTDAVSFNYVKTQFINQNSIFSDSKINWAKNYGAHSFEVNAGVRLIGESYKSEYAFGHNTGSDQVREMSNSLMNKTVKGVDDPYKLLTYYGVLNYGFRDKYFIEGAVSTESSSRFGSDTKSGFQMFGVSWAVFPSVSGAWLISSEKFMSGAKFIDKLKLRAGIGLSGNDDIESTASRAYFNAVKFSFSATGIELHNIANTSLQWETVLKRNIGLDATLFNGKLDLTFDVYNNISDNLLMPKNADNISGINSYWTNDGKLQNNGVEFGINAVVVQTKNFSATVGGSITHNENKILALTDGNFLTSVYGGQVLTAVNQPIGQFYGYKTNGVFATTEQATTAGLSVRQSTGALLPLQAGDVMFINQNPAEDKVIDGKDKVVIGNSNPVFYGTLNAGIKYRDFGVKVIFNYSYGNDVYNYLRSQIESGSTFYNQSISMNNRWLTEGQNTSIPKSEYGDPKGNNRFSDRWIEDGSYLKLKTLEMSYAVPVKNISFLQGLTLWVSANNLWTFTKYLGVDPEFSVSNNIFYKGVDNGLLSQSKSYYAGVRINL